MQQDVTRATHYPQSMALRGTPKGAKKLVLKRGFA